MTRLSVLICTVHTRRNTFGPKIAEQIYSQYEALPVEDQARVEVLILCDAKSMMLGAKRNSLVDIASGDYITFVDDDDRLADDYLSSLLGATSSDADVITFLVSVSLNGGEPKICRYSKDFPHDHNTASEYQRIPNHITCVKRELASQVSFPHIPKGEDSAYAVLLHPLLKTEHAIDRVLYYYDYSDATTETQPKRGGKLRMRNRTPLADIIVLSRADEQGMAEMTQNTINTCISGANSLPVNVIVVEQNPDVSYRGAYTLRPEGEFHYNGFANQAARLGRAAWIMLANNDLIFHDGWLHHLLAAGHPIVSPKCPRDSRQADIVENTTGTRTGRHLSGWCFMVERVLWARMGGFDESVSFWASDDIVIEQVKARGIEPMLVPAAKVEHLLSRTLNAQPGEIRDDLTWGQLDIFIQKYGGHRLDNHPKYLKWKAAHARRA